MMDQSKLKNGAS